jgi:hypothetical protein
LRLAVLAPFLLSVVVVAVGETLLAWKCGAALDTCSYADAWFLGGIAGVFAMGMALPVLALTVWEVTEVTLRRREGRSPLQR